MYPSWEEYERTVSVLEPSQRANYERAGIILQPKQIAFAKRAREADNMANPNEIGVGGARGGGKSFSVFAQIAADDCVRFPGLKVLYLRRTAKASQEQLFDLTQSILSHVDCEPKATRIDYPNGSRIVIGGYKDDKEAMKYQGIEFDTLVIEELTQLTEHTYKTLRLSARSSKGWRPRYYNTFNPLGIGHQWVKKRFIDPFRRGEATKAVFIPSTVEDNAFNNLEYVDNLDELTGAEKRAFRYGDWDVASGAYFETWHYDSHTIPPLEHIPDYWTVWAAMDAGFQHWNMIYFLAEDTDGNIIIFHELAHRKCHPDVIAPDVLNAMDAYNIPRHRFAGFYAGTDAFQLRAGQETTLADQYGLYNIALQMVDMSPGTRILGWQRMSKLLGDPRNGKVNRLFITRNCDKLIDTLPYLECDPNHPEDINKWDTDENGNGGDDPADAARYGVFSAPNHAGIFVGVGGESYDPLKGAF